MKRVLFNLAAAVSLLLCLAIAVLWISSYHMYLSVRETSGARDSRGFAQRSRVLFADNGRFLIRSQDTLWLWSDPNTTPIAQGMEHTNGRRFSKGEPFDVYRGFQKLPGDRSWELNVAGIWYRRVLRDATGPRFVNVTKRQHPLPGYPGASGFALRIPHGYVCALLAILPIWSIAKWRRRRRINRRGLCPKCAYSLVGNVSGVCPECGHQIVITQRARRNDPG